MSLKIISKQSNESITNFWSRIETETGVTIEWALGSNSLTFSISKITFSDGNYVDKNVSTMASGMDNDRDWVVLIDNSNHLFILTRQELMNEAARTSPSSPMTSCGLFMILDLDGLLGAFKTNHFWYDAFNIPNKTNNNPTAQTIKILPAYIYNDNADALGYAKNLYINYDRTFNAGLKFIDQNGNRFVTLGGYLLYKED